MAVSSLARLWLSGHSPEAEKAPWCSLPLVGSTQQLLWDEMKRGGEHEMSG